MSLAQLAGEEEARPSSFSSAFSSNNPFRNGAVSPPQAPTRDPPPRPTSRNPFFDDAGTAKACNTHSSSMNNSSPIPPLASSAAELFDSLTLVDETLPNLRPSPSSRGRADPLHQENIPPPPYRAPSSERAALQRGALGRPQLPAAELGSVSPEKPAERRHQRNRSLAEQKASDPEDKKRQERRRREQRHNENHISGGLKAKKPNRKLDIIDQLDATGIYGAGLFHHDGPFDACNPHRNKKGSIGAPMQAFPEDSLNNVLGGGGPLNKKPDQAAFLGNNDSEAFKDYSACGAETAVSEPYVTRAPPTQSDAVQSSLQKIEPVHGDESLGLGTSTFLEGAPASRVAIQRNSEGSSSLARKQSLAQRIRGINNNRRDVGASQPARINADSAPEGRDRATVSESSRLSNGHESKVSGKKGVSFLQPDSKSAGARGSSSSDNPASEGDNRATTSDNGSEDAPRPSMGFLSRVKSIKGGPKWPKTEKPVSD